MEAVRTSETSVDNYFTRQYIPEDNSEHHTLSVFAMCPTNIILVLGTLIAQRTELVNV
jgi:hypothetical protein